MNPLNPILPFNPNLPNDQVLGLQKLFTILGGLSSNGPPMTPNVQQPTPQPQLSSMKSILGGLSAS